MGDVEADRRRDGHARRAARATRRGARGRCVLTAAIPSGFAARFPRSTLVVLGAHELEPEVRAALTNTLVRLGGEVVLLETSGTAGLPSAAMRDDLGAAGVGAEVVVAAASELPRAVAVQLEQGGHDLVLVVVDHFGASALGTLDEAGRVLGETVGRGSSLLFLAPPFLPA